MQEKGKGIYNYVGMYFYLFFRFALGSILAL